MSQDRQIIVAVIRFRNWDGSSVRHNRPWAVNFAASGVERQLYESCNAAFGPSGNGGNGLYTARKQVTACIVRNPAAEAISNGRY